MTAQAEARKVGVTIAPLAFCTDNAAMIGAAALARLARTVTYSSLEIGVAPRWPLDRADELYKTPPPF
jgi:N6-L-threonylcarbamoyladenine synthase